MSNSINLIEKQTGKNDRVELAEKLKRISLILLLSVGLFSIVIFLLSYRFSIGYVRAQEDKLTKKMTSYDQLGSKMFLLNSRLTDVSFLLSSRKKYNKVSEEIIKVAPDGLKITRYQIDSGGIQVDASSANLADLNNFLNSLLSLSQNKTISSILIRSLGANSTGYSAQLLIN